MTRALTAALAIVLISGPAPAKTRKPRPAAFVASPAQFSFAYEADAENQLFALANEARAQAGVPALQRDEGLTQAAREHAAGMAAQQQLSHQFSGEASVHQRLTAATPLHLDRAGENVAYAATVALAPSSGKPVESGVQRGRLRRRPQWRFAIRGAGFRTRFADQQFAAKRGYGGRERNPHAGEVEWLSIAASGRQWRPRGHLFHGSGGFFECVVESRAVFSPLHQPAAGDAACKRGQDHCGPWTSGVCGGGLLRADGKLSGRGVLDRGGFLLIQSRIVFAESPRALHNKA